LLSGLLTLEDAARRLYIDRLRGYTTVFTNGVFDLIHRGHLEYLREAASMGHNLVVGLNSDASVRRLKGEQRPLLSEQDRAMALLALRWVDMVILFDEDTPIRLIEALQPNVLVKGGDYQTRDIVGADLVQQTGGKVVTIPFREGYSTSGLIDTIVERYADSCLKT
jgi:rfaE bifunctional protein nucleotidyltransferase chain/domain